MVAARGRGGAGRGRGRAGRGWDPDPCRIRPESPKLKLGDQKAHTSFEGFRQKDDLTFSFTRTVH